MYITAFFTEAGSPKTGLSPIVDAYRVSDSVLVINAQSMIEMGNGWYKYDFTGYVEGVEYVVTCDGGSVLNSFERYKPGGNETFCDYVSDIKTDTTAILLDTGTDGVVVAPGSKAGYELSAAGVDAIHDEIIEGALTDREMKRINHAVLAGKTTGGGTTTLTFRDDADSKARLTATVDVNRNRTNIVKDGT